MLRVGLWAQYNQDAFDTEHSLVTYILGMTKDKAADWAHPHIMRAMKRQPNALATMREFAEEFSKAFKDPDAKQLAARKIGELTQTGDVKSYITDFENLQAELDWNKGALQSTFEQGLHWKVKEILSQIYPAPSTFEDIKSHVCQIDATCQENEASRPQKPPKKSSTASTTTTTTKTTTKTPLSESANYVSPEEQDKRRKENLCIKCGNPDHRFKECTHGWSKERKTGKGKKMETAKIAKAESEPESNSEN